MVAPSFKLVAGFHRNTITSHHGSPLNPDARRICWPSFTKQEFWHVRYALVFHALFVTRLYMDLWFPRPWQTSRFTWRRIMSGVVYQRGGGAHHDGIHGIGLVPGLAPEPLHVRQPASRWYLTSFQLKNSFFKGQIHDTGDPLTEAAGLRKLTASAEETWKMSSKPQKPRPIETAETTSTTKATVGSWHSYWIHRLF